MTAQRFVAYYRVSTTKQGLDGLGIAAQRSAVEAKLNGGGWHMVAEFTEVESGRRRDRPELAKAIAACRKHKAKLVVATMSRLTRDPRVLRELQDAGIDLLFCDLDIPAGAIGRLVLGVLAHINEFEALQTGERTKRALAQAKKRGVILGNPRLAEVGDKGARVNAERALQRARNVMPLIESIRRDGAVSLRSIAAALTERRIPTATGLDVWSPMGVRAVLQRAGA